MVLPPLTATFSRGTQGILSKARQMRASIMNEKLSVSAVRSENVKWSDQRLVERRYCQLARGTNTSSTPAAQTSV